MKKNSLKRVFYGLKDVERVCLFGLEKNLFWGQFQHQNYAVGNAQKFECPPQPGLVAVHGEALCCQSWKTFNCGLLPHQKGRILATIRDPFTTTAFTTPPPPPTHTYKPTLGKAKPESLDLQEGKPSAVFEINTASAA